MDSDKMRKIFECRMKNFKSTEDATFLCQVASTYALFEILDEIDQLKKKLNHAQGKTTKKTVKKAKKKKK